MTDVLPPPPPVSASKTDEADGDQKSKISDEAEAMDCVSKSHLSFDQRLSLLRQYLFEDRMTLILEYMSPDARNAVGALVDSGEARQISSDSLTQIVAGQYKHDGKDYLPFFVRMFSRHKA